MVDARTLAVYDQKAADYADLVKSDSADAILQNFINMLPAGGHVLDLGCGPATASAHMRAAGLHPDPVDASAGMVAQANAAFEIGARQLTFDAVDMVAAYDGIWANFSLLHAPRADLPRHLSALVRALRPGGIFHIGMKTGTGSARDSIDRLYTYVTNPELRQLLTDAGLTVTSETTGADTGLDGSVAPWVVLQARKHG